MGDDEEAKGRKAQPQKKRAPASKSPNRAATRPPHLHGGGGGAQPQAAAKKTSPTRPPSASNVRKPAPRAQSPKRPPAGGTNSGRTAPIPKGSNRPPPPRSSDGNDDSSEEAPEEDKFDHDGLNKQTRNARSRPASNHSRGGNGQAKSSIRDRLRTVSGSFRGKNSKSDHSRGTTHSKASSTGGSSHHSNKNKDGGPIVPYDDGDGYDSFHNDDPNDYGDENNQQLAIVPAEDADYGADFEENKLRPPPKVKLAREDSDLGEFPDDKWWQKCLRHFRILSPHPQEDELKKQIRYLIWCTLILDVLVAIVSIATFGDGVTSCCGTAVMAAGIAIDWDTFMKVVTWIYLVGIFLEIHPVVREGPIPWNLLNPAFGFLISFAVFVDDSKAEAISIWIMEFASVILELITFRKLKQIHQRKIKRLEELEEDIANEKYSHGYRKTAFLRERRETRLIVSESEKKLRYHFVGSTVAAALVSITLLLIIFVARGGGLCLVGGTGPGSGLDIFNPDQKSRCTLCGDENGWTDRCIKCKNPGTEYEEPDQCYFPYF